MFCSLPVPAEVIISFHLLVKIPIGCGKAYNAPTEAMATTSGLTFMQVELKKLKQPQQR